MDQPSILELIVGVDLGFTCTGVAFCESNKASPIVISEWPQSETPTKPTADLTTNPIATATTKQTLGGVKHKVPTRLAYRGGRSEPSSWGFQCPFPGDFKAGITVIEHFKLCLDEEVLNGAFGEEPDLAPGSFLDVQNWFRHFLTALYKHIAWYFEKEYPGLWETSKVEYIFSYPTTWKKKVVVDQFEAIVKEAGFGDGKNKNHTVGQGLSEAEAAALYAAMSPEEHHIVSRPNVSDDTRDQTSAIATEIAYKKGDVLLVCDAGGGTTDVCVLEVKSVEGARIELHQLSHVKGRAIGSVQIDEEFRGIAEERLTIIKGALRDIDTRLTPRYTAREMARGPFQFHKHNFGDEVADLDVVAIPVPALSSNFDCKEAGIENGRMVFTKGSIESMFDKKVKEIIKLIDKQLTMINSSKEVSYLVLAGGLGASKHVQYELSSRYSNTGMNIVVSKDPKEPPLAVCKGLVAARIHELRYKSSALTIRRCRASYGILIPKEGKRMRIGRRSTTHKIHWMVKKGEPMQQETQTMSRTVDSINPQKVWANKIVISSLHKDKLPTKHPTSDKSPLAPTIITYLESSLLPYGTLSPDTTPGITAIKHRLVGLRPSKLKISYDVAVTASPAGLEFKSLLGGSEEDVIGEKLVPISWTIFPETMVEETRGGVGGEQGS